MYKLNRNIQIHNKYEMPAITYALCGTNFGLTIEEKNDKISNIYFIKKDVEENKVYLIGYADEWYNGREYFRIIYDCETKNTIKNTYKTYESVFPSKSTWEALTKAFKFNISKGDKVYISEEIFKNDEGFAFSLVINNLEYFKPSDLVVSLRDRYCVRCIREEWRIFDEDDYCKNRNEMDD